MRVFLISLNVALGTYVFMTVPLVINALGA